MIIGVTGGLGTGTSTAAGYIAKELKAGLVDADKITRDQLSRNSLLKKRVVSAFGRSVLNNRKSIDRAALAEKSFSSKAGHRKLCAITHPVILDKIRSFIEKFFKKSDYVIVDGPVLIESGFYKECDFIILVTSSLALQLERASLKKIAQKDAISRIRLQMPLHEKAKYADYIIDNSSGLAGLRSKCRQAVKNIRTKK